jgi:hypothetical protein
MRTLLPNRKTHIPKANVKTGNAILRVFVWDSAAIGVTGAAIGNPPTGDYLTPCPLCLNPS